ncbi:MAG: 3-oxoacyl-[acyl-carrier protein] reductase [Ignavibacteriae bacterium]|nr:MAG: 3-oxoacyl-[acyl-carrier protein] reductase [Ignavibacteriota bacterium]
MINTALITGASTGIGLEFAKIFAKENYDLILVSRNEKKLNEIKNSIEKDYRVKVKIIPKDLAEKNSAFEIYDEICKENLKVDVLINNAGFGALGNFEKIDWKTQADMLEVNITALTYLTHLFLKHMKERGEGKILNVASTAAFQPGPLMAVYYATKAYVLSFSLALAEETKNSNVTVTVLCPGPTTTEFQERAGMKQTKIMRLMKFLPADYVANYGFKALMKSKRLAIPGWLNKISVSMVKFLPQNFIVKIIKYLKSH